MVVLAASQPRQTYLLWKRFTYPTEHGPQDAYSVPIWAASQFNSAYAIIVGLLMVEVWTIIIALALFLVFRWQRRQSKGSALHPVVPILWNNRGAIDGSFIEISKYIKRENARPWVFFILLLTIAAWAAQTAVAIIIPPMIILSNAAPVNPKTVYTPYSDSLDFSKKAAAFSLQVPAALRAAGNSEFPSDILDKRIMVNTEKLGSISTGEQILRTNYSYNVTGVDFGLQKYPDLKLYVTGSCITDYEQLNHTSYMTVNEKIITVDTYKYSDGGNQGHVGVSLFNGRPPFAFFIAGEFTKGTLERSNITWSAIISSVNRTSFSPSTDPWYRTERFQDSDVGAAYMVLPGRPVLSCWEDNTWSYKGFNSTATELSSDHLPGLVLSKGVQKIFSFMNGSMVGAMGQQLGSFALQSGLKSLGFYRPIFDAGASSIHNDLNRLVRIAFVATCSLLSDSTLYPIDASSKTDNIITAQDDAGDFVVWSSDVAALSVKLIIAFPSILIGSWLCAILLLFFTPVRLVKGLDSSSMFAFIQKQHPTFGPTPHKDGRVNWQEYKGGFDAEQAPETQHVEKQGTGLSSNSKEEVTRVTGSFEESFSFRLPLHQAFNEASALGKTFDNSKARRLPGLRCVERRRFTAAKTIVLSPSDGTSWNHVKRSSPPMLPSFSILVTMEVGVGTGTPAYAVVLCQELCEDRDAGIGVWAEAAKEYPEWWTQSQGDDLLLRRTKMRLRHNYDQTRKYKGKKHAVDVQQAFAATSTWPGHPETSGTYSSPTYTLDSFPASSLDSFSNGYLSTSESNLYPLSSMTSGQVRDGGMGERSSTARRLLGMAGMLDLGQDASSAANAFAMYPNIEHQPNVWTSYEPPQPSLTFEQAWYGGDQATQLDRSAHEALTHTVNGNYVELNLDDP
ncbi:hypothetical protein V8C42DRAFT_359598 [Trichoderma barbatum]